MSLTIERFSTWVQPVDGWASRRTRRWALVTHAEKQLDAFRSTHCAMEAPNLIDAVIKVDHAQCCYGRCKSWFSTSVTQVRSYSCVQLHALNLEMWLGSIWHSGRTGSQGCARNPYCKKARWHCLCMSLFVLVAHAFKFEQPLCMFEQKQQQHDFILHNDDDHW